ncbi:MAG: pyruvate dehydrogenase (acetyl-transferring) E1 component subunit alpha, partial [Beijerinckiaceae bacterium]
MPAAAKAEKAEKSDKAISRASKAAWDKRQELAAYREMLLIRRFEEKAG